jgi:endo-alpha-1,4-polygalactosaminidase (GH114 family)
MNPVPPVTKTFIRGEPILSIGVESRLVRTAIRRVGGFGAIAGVGIAAALLLGSSAPAGAGVEPQSFAFAIGNGTLKGNAAAVGERYQDFDLVIVDGEEASGVEIAAIQSGGADVLGYLSVGTIEKWRGWYQRLKAYRLSAWQDWKDEWFADTSKAKYRDKLLEIADEEILDKGFDGLFLDNVDMVEVRKHKRQRSGMGKLVESLDSLVGQRLLFAQNGAPGVLDGYPGQDVAPLIDHLDGWNREDVTWTYDFDRRRYVPNRTADREAALDELQEIAGAGLTTTATDYVDLEDGIDGEECEALTNAEGVGALPYLANIGLTIKAVEANPVTC